MVKDFYSDLGKAAAVEKMVCRTLEGLTDEYVFIPVGDNPEYYHRGDIIAKDKSGNTVLIEVKADSRIGSTHNVLCEEEVYYHRDCEYVPGNFYSPYQIYCVVSEQERKMYFMDFKVLKAIYRSYGYYKEIPHYDQTTFCYLLPLGRVKQFGGLIKEIDY